MKVLFLTKRHLTAKDIVLEKFGRYYEIAAGLAALGWEVKGYCMDYRSWWTRETVVSGSVEWRSYSAPLLWHAWRRDVLGEARSWKPDVVFASSDPVHIAGGREASCLSRAPLAVDLHDNLESFRLMTVPGLGASLRKAVRDARIVSCVSEPLREKVLRDYDPQGKVSVLENAVPGTFEASSVDKMTSRRRFGLRESDTVIGLAGALYRKRGIDVILAGFDRLRKDCPGLVLALAGPADRSGKAFEREGIRYFGNLDYSSMPSFMGTFDVGIVPNIRPLFAEYCYPQKAVELCSMRVPVVAADIGVMRNLAKGSEQILYRPRDPADFARALKYQLENRVALDVAVKTWPQQAAALDRSLRECSRGSAPLSE